MTINEITDNYIVIYKEYQPPQDGVIEGRHIGVSWYTGELVVIDDTYHKVQNMVFGQQKVYMKNFNRRR